MRRPAMEKPGPLDYLVMIGGPLLFLIVAGLGIRSLLGSGPEPSAVDRLRRGEIRLGASEAEVLRRLGPPKGVVDLGDGKYAYRYQKSSWDSERRIALEEDAYVDFTPGGQVANIGFESRPAPLVPQETQEAGTR